MKKIVFSALACVAFAFSCFASNEVVEDFSTVFSDPKDPCQLVWRIYSVDENGIPTLVEIGTGSSKKTGKGCAEWAIGVIDEKEKEFPKYKVTYELTSELE